MDWSAVEDLARMLYPHMVAAARSGNGRITYSELCAKLEGRWADTNPHDPYVAEALGEIAGRCLAAGLPPLSAIVVGKERGYPGPGYFTAAHPEIEDEIEQMRAWDKDRRDARRAARADMYATELDKLARG